eukprot:11229821-Alexandrium_andersonii.AAC.1
MERSWKPVFDGNGQAEEVAASFLGRYGQYLYRQEEEHLPELRPGQVLATFRATKASAQGADNWMPA